MNFPYFRSLSINIEGALKGFIRNGLGVFSQRQRPPASLSRCRYKLKKKKDSAPGIAIALPLQLKRRKTL
jgi:hypothetical protein